MFDVKKYRREYYLRNREKALSNQKEYAVNNRAKISAYQKTYRKENPKDYSEYQRGWYLENRERIIKKQAVYQKKRKSQDIAFRLKANLRNRLYLAVTDKRYRTLSLLGCSIEFLKKHLEEQFQPGMSWENYGQWHIDHIKPCAKFDLTKAEEQKKCFHYSNLQPLWAKDNLKKHCKLV